MKAKLPLAIMLLLIIAVSGCVSTTGNLVLQITDRPALNIEKAEVTISQVQVHKAVAGDNESNASAEWITVVEGPQKYDLVAIKDVKAYLGGAVLSAGRYTQIKLNVDSALVTIDGEEHDLTIPSKTVKLVRSFLIGEGQTTTLTLDFDAEGSVHEAAGRYIMRPTIKIIQEGGPSKPSKETEEEACLNSGGEVTTAMCCLQTDDFPNTCAIGPCGCATENSHEVVVCDCGEGMCFNGNSCIEMEGEEPEEEDETCTSENGTSMLLSEAREIALASDCVEDGTLEEPYVCNSVTGTWWLDLDIEIEGCNPACVVNIETGEAEINWRCTGALP
jgi:hypothetical protein